VERDRNTALTKNGQIRRAPGRVVMCEDGTAIAITNTFGRESTAPGKYSVMQVVVRPLLVRSSTLRFDCHLRRMTRNGGFDYRPKALCAKF
jgi:hypothetical protein